MKFPAFLVAAVIAMAHSAPAAPLHCYFECTDRGLPNKLLWQTETGMSYDLFFSPDLSAWSHVEGFPRNGDGGVMNHPFTPGTRGFFQISPAPEGFAWIPGGSFAMGGDRREGWLDGEHWVEEPVHRVQVSGFYMARHEVTKALWDDVRAWAGGHGYTDLHVGFGKAGDHPVVRINWFAMVKWCNARSEKEGLTPCYRVGGAVYRTGDSGAVTCDWHADGYRLATEAEWERAARGGLSGRRFPWGDTISHANANFLNAHGETYQSGTTGPHPSYNDGVQPYTSPVGSFAPNGYGLYDMAGNVWECCWDWWGADYYVTSPGTDPRGPATGSYRVIRGGCWDDFAGYSRCACRLWFWPDAEDFYGGFRLARGQ